MSEATVHAHLANTREEQERFNQHSSVIIKCKTKAVAKTKMMMMFDGEIIHEKSDV